MDIWGRHYSTYHLDHNKLQIRYLYPQSIPVLSLLFYLSFPLLLFSKSKIIVENSISRVSVSLIHDQKFKKANALSPYLLGRRLVQNLKVLPILVPRFSQPPIQPPGKTSRCPLESLTHDNMLTQWTQEPHSRTFGTLLGSSFQNLPNLVRENPLLSKPLPLLQSKCLCSPLPPN